MQLNIHSIFSTISGEHGFIPQGQPATFVRLAKCDLRCPWCDAKNALTEQDGKSMSIGEIMNQIQILGNAPIVITGGEPLLQEAGVTVLASRIQRSGGLVQIETSGHRMTKMKHVHSFVVDYKLSGSKMNRKMMMPEEYLHFPSEERTVYIKFVIGDIMDFDEARTITRQIFESFRYKVQKQNASTLYTGDGLEIRPEPFCAPIFLYSPVHDVLDPKELYEWMIQYPESRGAILNIQIHKYIGMNKMEEQRAAVNVNPQY